MQKIEIIHPKSALNRIQALFKHKTVPSITTLRVVHGVGPSIGVYHDDGLVDERYYTMIIVPVEEAESWIKQLKSCLAEYPALILTSNIQYLYSTTDL